MAKVRVKLFGSLREMASSHIKIVEAYEVKDLLEKLASTYGQEFYKRTYLILLNGRSIYHYKDKERTKLKDGDVISLFPPVGGG